MVKETFYGYVETTHDALLIFEGCKRGLLPRVGRRLKESERHLIRSGSIFVFDEKEAGIKRWTDGKVWSPSRILGNFLIYREFNKNLPRDDIVQLDKERERHLMGCLSDDYALQRGGLIKKTMSIVVNGTPQHFISYYDPREVIQHQLQRTSSSLHASLEVSPEFLVTQSFRIPPVFKPHPYKKQEERLHLDQLLNPHTS